VLRLTANGRRPRVLLRLLVAGLAAAGPQVGCGSPTRPGATSGQLLVVSSGGLLVVDPRTGEIVTRVSPQVGAGHTGRFELSPDSSRLYFLAADSGEGNNELVALDRVSLATLWHERLSAMADRGAVSNLSMQGYGFLAVGPNAASFLVDAVRADTAGLAIVDAQRRAATGFLSLATLAYPNVAVVQPDVDFPDGLVLVAGQRASGTWSVFLRNPNSLALEDSIRLTDATGAAIEGPYQLGVAGGGRVVFAIGPRRIARVDLGERRVTAALDNPIRVWQRVGFATSADGTVLYLTDPGDGRDSPGSGKLYVLRPDRPAIDSIDLSAILPPGSPPTGNAVAVSAEGAFAYVASGTLSAGPLFGLQPGRLFTVDLSRRIPTAVYDLGVWYPSQLFLF